VDRKVTEGQAHLIRDLRSEKAAHLHPSPMYRGATGVVSSVDTLAGGGKGWEDTRGLGPFPGWASP
jgi:hypothetical protein